MKLLAGLRTTLLGLMLVFAGSGWTLAQTIHFKAPAGITGLTVEVLADQTTTTPETVAAVEDGWEYTVQTVDGKWRNEPTFLITIPARPEDSNGFSSDKTTLELAFSFKASQIKQRFEVPIALYTGASGADRDALATMPAYRGYEKILMAQALTINYVTRLEDKQNDFARRTVQTWFEATYAAITVSHWPLRIGDQLQQRLSDIFAGDPSSLSHYHGAEAQIRQGIWLDQADMTSLLKGPHPNCGAAVALVSFLDGFNSAFKDDAIAMGIDNPAAVISALQARVVKKCPNVVNDIDG